MVVRCWKFHHEGNCSASRGLPSDAEQLHVPEWRNFQFAPMNHCGFYFLHTLLSTIAFRLEYVLFYQFYAKITTCFDQEKFGTTPLLYVDVEMFGGNWRENDVNASKITLKSSYWCHARESSYTPHVRRHFLTRSGSRKSRSGMQELSFRIFVAAYRSCYSTEFPCRNKMCLPNGMLCDGVANCLDGSDEDHCGTLNFDRPNE